jgi:hypothetical protein
MSEQDAMGYSSVNSTEDVTSLCQREIEAVYDWHFVRCVPETPCGQKLLIVSQSQLLVRVEEENEGLEWDVREELVPGFRPKPVATGLGLCQDEPQVERRAGGKGPDLDSRRP